MSSTVMPAGAGPAPARRFLFGPAVFCEHGLELTVHGQDVELERKPLEVLRHLLLHSGEVVTKDELAEACWPGRILSDSVLSKALGKLREALGDEQQQIIKTVHGYGYRLLAPVKVEAAPSVRPPRFDFGAGDCPPLRPLWKLERRLGAGGHGEVWLAHHEKTREARVFKFALDAAVLSSLKREITIYRLLNDTLGERPDLVRLLDWNLAEPPYFVECEHVAGGNLQEWAASPNAAPEARFELVARIADALAAAHSVGVLHKDLKPANVLIEAGEGGAPAVKLCDFGSGGVLDQSRLEQLGITRLGFTQAVTDRDTSGTLQYLAPEVVAGQPATVQADIYALGVVLYQLVIADLRKPLASGWEQDISDELLREDIADATNGNPARRIGDAAQLAQRLRALPARRDRRAVEREQAAGAERARRELERSRLRRVWMGISSAALAAGMAISLALYLRAERARHEAEVAADTAEAVTAFLTEDLPAAADVEQGSIKDVSLKSLLDQAGARVSERFSGRPGVAARVHLALASSYYGLAEISAVKRHADSALVLLQQIGEGASRDVLRSKRFLAQAAQHTDRHEEALALYGEVLEGMVAVYGVRHAEVLEVRRELSWAQFNAGQLAPAATQLRTLLDDARQLPDAPAELLEIARTQLGSYLSRMGHFAEAAAVTQEAIAVTLQRVKEPELTLATARMSLGGSLIELGRLTEAEKELASAEAQIRQLVPVGHPYLASVQSFVARLRVEQGRNTEAAKLLHEAIKTRAAAYGADTGLVAWTRHLLAECYQRAGELKAALKEMEQALPIAERMDGVGHPDSVKQRVHLSEILRELGDTKRARAVFKAIPADAIAGITEGHPYLAKLYRQDGLLMVAEGNLPGARATLSRAVAILELRHGANHWRTRQAREELARVDRVAPQLGAR